jgi:hypothetical protein
MMYLLCFRAPFTVTSTQSRLVRIQNVIRNARDARHFRNVMHANDMRSAED